MTGPRTCRTILIDTLSELAGREALLTELQSRVGDELTEARAAITVIERLLRGELVPLSASVLHVSTNHVDVGRRSGDLKRAVIELLRAHGDLMTREELSMRLGVNGRGLSIVIGKAVAKGELVEQPRGLGVPSALSNEE